MQFSKKNNISLSITTILCSLLVFFLTTISTSAKQPPWLDDKEITRLYEILDVFHKKGILSPPPTTTAQIIAPYITQYDPYAHIYSAEEYQAFKASFKSLFGGVQMEIQPLSDGRVICHPYPKGIAAKAGIKEGDQLLAIDGKSIADIEIHIVAMSIRGVPGTTVQLTIQTDKETFRNINLTRSLTKGRSVWQKKIGPYQVCRIHSFRSHTPKELESCVTKLTQKDAFLILDLRGNAGGDLNAAINATKLFLPKESTIVTISGKKSNLVHFNKNRPIFHIPSIILLQDRHTASASEVFIAALTDNNKAISLGEQSFGKGVTQKFIKFQDGSAILLSYAWLIPPGKNLYHNKGLSPNITVAMKPTQEESSALLKQLKEILTKNL